MKPEDQLSIDFSRKDLAEQGAQLAADHADAVIEDWQDRAFYLLTEFCRHHAYGAQLTSERIRQYAEKQGLPNPPDKRAWGAIMLKAARKNLIRKIGWTTANDPKVHNNPVSLWTVGI